jgi:hypothetical protein
MMSLDWGDPAAVKRWAVALQDQIADALDAGLDATAAPSRRSLGRRTARRKLREAHRAIGSLFLLAGLADEGQLEHRGAAIPPAPPSGVSTREGGIAQAIEAQGDRIIAAIRESSAEQQRDRAEVSAQLVERVSVFLRDALAEGTGRTVVLDPPAANDTNGDNGGEEPRE